MSGDCCLQVSLCLHNVQPVKCHALYYCVLWNCQCRTHALLTHVVHVSNAKKNRFESREKKREIWRNIFAMSKCIWFNSNFALFNLFLILFECYWSCHLSYSVRVCYSIYMFLFLSLYITILLLSSNCFFFLFCGIFFKLLFTLKVNSEWDSVCGLY